MYPELKLFIAGEWRSTHRDMPVMNPATEQEIGRLARAEISENLSRAIVAVGLIAGAAIIALVALNVLAAALVAGLTELGLDAGWAALIVGAVLGLLAYLLILKGINDLKLSSLAPTRTARNLRRDAAAVKDVYDDK